MNPKSRGVNVWKLALLTKSIMYLIVKKTKRNKKLNKVRIKQNTLRLGN